MATALAHDTDHNTPVEEARWRAVLERDAASDGAFVYAVDSTGIYCRPSCPSRKPARQQVRFFPVPELAEKQGFRPCKRCQPDQHPAAGPQLELARQVCGLIQENLEAPLTLAQLGRQVGSSPYHLQRVFKKLMGVSPRQYADFCRIGRLRTRLKDSPSVAGAMYDAGYGSSGGLYQHASQRLGMTPSRLRRGGPGVGIAYTIARSSLGLLLVAATQQGVCAVSLGEDEVAMVNALSRDYPAAEITRDDPTLRPLVSDVLEHLAGRLPHAEIPLDVRATAFERMVWEELQRIPWGQTRSYGQVARAIGRPGAARAVARACAHNPAAVVIPCHRVVRQDGDLAGYRWGLERKRALLAQERAQVKDR